LVRRGISAKLMSVRVWQGIQTVLIIAPAWKPRADFGARLPCQRPVRTKRVQNRDGWLITSSLTPFPICQAHLAGKPEHESPSSSVCGRSMRSRNRPSRGPPSRSQDAGGSCLDRLCRSIAIGLPQQQLRPTVIRRASSLVRTLAWRAVSPRCGGSRTTPRSDRPRPAPRTIPGARLWSKVAGGHYPSLPRPSTSRSISCDASSPDSILPICSGGIDFIIFAFTSSPPRKGHRDRSA
jgi:hypothetical protein